MTRLLCFLGIAPALLEAVFLPPPGDGYGGESERIDAYGWQQILKGFCQTNQEFFCRLCMDFCVNPDEAQYLLADRDNRVLFVTYRVARRVSAFRFRTQAACLRECSRELRVVLQEHLPGYAQSVVEDFPVDDPRTATKDAWVGGWTEEVSKYRCSAKDQKVRTPKQAPQGAQQRSLDPSRADPLEILKRKDKKDKKDKRTRRKNRYGKGFSAFTLPSAGQLYDGASRVGQNILRNMQRSLFGGGGGGGGSNRQDGVTPGAAPGAGVFRPLGVP